MSNLVIVAIPDENDRVWKVSSEKIPHMTLLFLGDVDKILNADQIVQFVEHAANTTLRRFYLPVDRRDELGEDKADVLFFKKGRYDYKAVRDFRAALLKDDNIRTAYDSAPQFDGVWQPHLTLGYPSAPAKIEDKDLDFGFYDVSFNKVAVWMGDFEGPEFLLKDYWDEYEALETVPMDVAMSDVNQARIALGLDTIEHFGVKGMRWGVRRENVQTAGKVAKSVGRGLGRAAKRIGDVGFEANLQNEESRARTQLAIDTKARQAFKRTDLPALKERHGDYGKLLNRAKKPFAKEARAYRKDARETYIKRLEDAANSMTNVSGTRQYTIRERGWELPAEGGALPKSKHVWSVTSREIKHADGDEFTYDLEVIEDGEGYITDLNPVTNEDAMAQMMDLGAEFILEHYGVKGMRWGVRRDTQGRSRWDPEGHDLKTDIIKNIGFSLIPVAGIALHWPSTVRLGRRLGRHLKKGSETRKAEKSDRNWKKDFETSTKKAVEVHNKAADEINSKVEAFNNDKRWKSVDLTKNPAKQAAYDKAVQEELLNPAYSRAAIAVHGTKSPGGRYTLEIKDPKTAELKVTDTLLKEKEVEHAAEDEDFDYVLNFQLVRDSMGRLAGFEWPEAAKHDAMELADEFMLEHYGIKGMRWGVRRERGTPLAVAPMSTVRIPHGRKRKTKIKTEGGENQPAHDDAIKVAESRAKLKRSGTAALSNQELRDVANRLQLENQVKILTSSKGKQFVSKEFEKESGRAIKRGAKAAAPTVLKKGKKAAATVAVSALL